MLTGSTQQHTYGIPSHHQRIQQRNMLTSHDASAATYYTNMHQTLRVSALWVSLPIAVRWAYDDGPSATTYHHHQPAATDHLNVNRLPSATWIPASRPPCIVALPISFNLCRCVCVCVSFFLLCPWKSGWLRLGAQRRHSEPDSHSGPHLCLSNNSPIN